MRYSSLLLLLFISTFQVAFAQEKNPPLFVQLTLQNQTNAAYFCEGSDLSLMASSPGVGLKYSWYRESQPYQITASPTLRLREAGTYHVVVSDSTREATSEKISIQPCPNSQAEIDAIWQQAEADVNPKKPNTTPSMANSFMATVTSQNPVLCNGNSSAVLVAFPQGTQYSYQWQRANCLTCTYNTQSGLSNDTITTTATGFWRVLVTENTTTATSNPLRVSSTPYATLTDQNDNPNGIINISAGQSTSLKVSFVGQGPYVFSYSDGLVTRSVNTTTNPHTLAVTAFQNTRYTLTSAGNNACGTSGNDLVGNVRVITDPTTSVSLSMPINLNVCAGSTVSIPYTKIGTWTIGSSISVRLINEIDGSTVVTQSGLSSSPLQINVPSDAQVNRQYRVSVLPIMPVSVLGPVNSAYLLTVTSTGCTSKPIITTNTNPSCENAWLYPSYPSLPSGTTFQWIKDGSVMPNETSSALLAAQSGNYYVKIQNTTANYNDSSAVFSFTVLSEITSISSPNPLLCGSNTNAVLTATVITAGGTYQWFRNSTLIANATNSSYTATSTGTYSVQYTQNGCTNSRSFNVNNYANATLSTLSGATSATVPANQPVQLRATFEGQGPWTFQLGEGVFTRPTITTNSNPYTFTVQPDQNLLYSLTNVRSSNCSSSGSSSSVSLIIDPTTTVTLPTPTNLNVCAGSTIEIPFTQVGTWGNGRNLSVNVFNVNASNVESFHGDSPITYTVPGSLSTGTSFRISVRGFTPIFAPVYSSYQFTVTSTGCSPTATIKAPQTTTGCSVLLLAYPSNSSLYQYQWFRNGVGITSATDSYYYANQSGSYTVRITNNSGYNSTSTATNVTGTGFTGQINQATITCGTATLNATPADTAIYTYQWFDNNNNLMAGATLPNYSTTIAGTYRVQITHKTTGCFATPSFSASPNGSATLTNTNNNSNPISISPGQSATLRVTMLGQAPYTFEYTDGVNFRRISTNNAIYDFNVTPSQNTFYSSLSYANNCGTGSISGGVSVLVNPAASVTLLTPANLNICAGGSVEVPYTMVGTWGTERNLSVSLIDANGNSFAGISQFVTNPIKFQLPSNLALNSTYRIRILGTLPNFSSVTSTYQLTVNGTGCLPDPEIRLSSTNYCSSISLFATFLNGYTYEWKRDGVTVDSETNRSSYDATISGNYTVRITGPNGYDRTSTAVAVNIGLPKPTISSTGASCSNGVNFTLSSSVTDPNYTYQWYFAPALNGYFLPVAGGTSPTLVTNQSGAYFITVENGTCQAVSSTFRTCSLLVNFRSASVCQGGSIGNVSFFSSFGFNTTNVSTLRLVDATTGNVVVPSLATINGAGSIFANVAIPTSVPAGTYRLVVSMSIPTSTSAWSAGVLTVTNSVAPAAPTLTAMPTLVTPGQSNTLNASGCVGILRWTDNTTITATSRSVTPTVTTIYTVTCIDANGCMSAPSSVTVTLNCDPLEPNDTFQTATVITTVSYLSPDVCLSGGTDQDWYAYIHNNRVYYIKVRPYSSTGSSSLGLYRFSASVVNDSLRLETLPTNGSSVDTYIELYADNGTTLLGQDDDSGVNAFSFLRYKLPAPCPQNLSLYSTLLDIAPNQTNTARAININATNKVGNGATANYFGQSSVLLSPGFETQLSTSGTFVAEVRGCND
jgi:large repetitive protein